MFSHVIANQIAGIPRSQMAVADGMLGGAYFYGFYFYFGWRWKALGCDAPHPLT